MSKLKQIDQTSLPETRPVPIARLVEGWESLAARLAINFAEYDLGSLGKIRRVALVNESGKRVLIEDLPAAPHEKNSTTISVIEPEIDETSYSEILEAFLIAASISAADVIWKHGAIAFQPHEVWRQDDQGNHFLVRQTACKADALRLAAMFEARGHKQTYWVQPK